MIHYKNGAPQEIIDQLRNAFEGSNVSEVTIAPYNDMDNLITLTAWNYIDRLNEFDKERSYDKAWDENGNPIVHRSKGILYSKEGKPIER